MCDHFVTRSNSVREQYSLYSVGNSFDHLFSVSGLSLLSSRSFIDAVRFWIYACIRALLSSEVVALSSCVLCCRRHRHRSSSCRTLRALLSFEYVTLSLCVLCCRRRRHHHRSSSTSIASVCVRVCVERSSVRYVGQTFSSTDGGSYIDRSK